MSTQTQATSEPRSSTSASWLTVEHCAEDLSVSIDTIRRMVSRGELEARRIGKRNLRISRQSLEAVGRPIGAY